MKKITSLDWIFMAILIIAIILLFFDNEILNLISKIGIAISLLFLVIRNSIDYWKR